MRVLAALFVATGLMSGCRDLTESTALKLDFGQTHPAAPFGVPAIMADSQVATIVISLTDAEGRRVASDSARWSSSADSIVSVTPWNDENRCRKASDKDAVGENRACLVAKRSGNVTITFSWKQGNVVALEKSFPIRVNERWVSVAAGIAVTCAVNVRGRVFCWGNSEEVGSGFSIASVPIPTPVFAPNGVRFSKVFAGGAVACATVEKTGSAYCWGDNVYGTLGTDGRARHFYIPTPMAGGATYRYLAPGVFFSCGVQPPASLDTAKPAATCWGVAADNKIGNDGGPFNQDQEKCFGGAFFPCIILPGYDGPAIQNSANKSGISSIAVGLNHACFADEITNYVACWGTNIWGQLGGGASNDQRGRRVSFPASPAGAIPRISAGGLHSCVALALPNSDGPVYCWGLNDAGQSGPWTTPGCPQPVSAGNIVHCTAPTPQRISVQLSNVVAGYYSSCGFSRDGSAYCWGDNFFGQLGTAAPAGARCRSDDPTNTMQVDFECSSVPVRVALDPSRRFTALAAAGYHVCGITDPDGAIFCWGDNSWGELGNAGPAEGSRVPVRVKEPLPER